MPFAFAPRVWEASPAVPAYSGGDMFLLWEPARKYGKLMLPPSPKVVSNTSSGRKFARLSAGGNWIRNFSSALPSVVSRVSEIRDPGRAAGRIGVRFDPLQGELGFDFRLIGFGSRASSLVCRLEVFAFR
jgi:hypothetical protein